MPKKTNTEKVNHTFDKQVAQAIITSEAKDIISAVEQYRPDKNSIVLSDGSEISWKVKPSKKSTKFGLEFNKDFVDTDVENMVKIGGEVNYFYSPKGAADFIKSAEFSATKKF